MSENSIGTASKRFRTDFSFSLRDSSGILLEKMRYAPVIHFVGGVALCNNSIPDDIVLKNTVLYGGKVFYALTDNKIFESSRLVSAHRIDGK